jgi:hypothetical protein
MSIVCLNCENNSDDEYEKIAEIFPDANFIVAIELNDLDNIVTDEKNIIIKQR